MAVRPLRNLLGNIVASEGLVTPDPFRRLFTRHLLQGALCALVLLKLDLPLTRIGNDSSSSLQDLKDRSSTIYSPSHCSLHPSLHHHHLSFFPSTSPRNFQPCQVQQLLSLLAAVFSILYIFWLSSPPSRSFIPHQITSTNTITKTVTNTITNAVTNANATTNTYNNTLISPLIQPV